MLDLEMSISAWIFECVNVKIEVTSIESSFSGVFLIHGVKSQSLNASASKSPSVQRTFIIETRFAFDHYVIQLKFDIDCSLLLVVVQPEDAANSGKETVVLVPIGIPEPMEG